MENFIELGETYTDRIGVERECIFVEGHLAWLRRGNDGTAYVWVRDGRAVDLSCSYDIDPPKREPMQPPWDVLPESVKYVAMDEDGDTWGYECEPMAEDGVWANTHDSDLLALTCLRFPRGNMPWDQSLVKRPKEKNDE